MRWFPCCVAVGGQVTPLPPAQIPGCAANAPGSCRRSDVIGRRGLGGPYISDPWARGGGDMPLPALCPGHASQRTLPSTDRLPATVSATDVTRLCSRLPRDDAVVRLLISSGRADWGHTHRLGSGLTFIHSRQTGSPFRWPCDEEVRGRCAEFRNVSPVPAGAQMPFADAPHDRFPTN